jgi:hypothetical protein
MVHFHSEIELGASSFINHLLSKNEKIFDDDTGVKYYINQLMKRMNSVINRSPLKAFILKMISNLVTFKTKNQTEFQKIVFN